MTLRDFVKTYEEFEWESGEVVVVDQRYAVNFIFTCKDGELKNPLMRVCSEKFERMFDREVYSWLQSTKTMVITL